MKLFAIYRIINFAVDILYICDITRKLGCDIKVVNDKLFFIAINSLVIPSIFFSLCFYEVHFTNPVQ